MSVELISQEIVAKHRNFLARKKKIRANERGSVVQTTNLVCFGLQKESFGFELLKLKEILKAEGIARVPIFQNRRRQKFGKRVEE